MSIIGAIWAFAEARKAANSADKAEKARNSIVDRGKLVEVSQVYKETQRILKTVSKVGPTCTVSSIRGVKYPEIAKEVEEYCPLPL